MAIRERLQSRTHRKSDAVGHGHADVGMTMRIDRGLRDLDGLLSQHALNGDTDLPLIEHEGLCVEDAPARQHM